MTKRAIVSNFLKEFLTIHEICSGENALFATEQSARWFIRSRRAQLIEAKAVARINGVMLVHPQRLATVREREALAAAHNALTRK